MAQARCPWPLLLVFGKIRVLREGLAKGPRWA